MLEAAIGLELWSVTEDIYFDNFIISDDKRISDHFAANSWEFKHTEEEFDNHKVRNCSKLSPLK